MAVKKLMNSPTVFSPAMISVPANISTPKKPMPLMMSIMAGIIALPTLARTSVWMRWSARSRKRPAW